MLPEPHQETGRSSTSGKGTRRHEDPTRVLKDIRPSFDGPQPVRKRAEKPRGSTSHDSHPPSSLCGGGRVFGSPRRRGQAKAKCPFHPAKKAPFLGSMAEKTGLLKLFGELAVCCRRRPHPLYWGGAGPAHQTILPRCVSHWEGCLRSTCGSLPADMNSRQAHTPPKPDKH